MPDYKLKEAASRLGAKPQKFTFYKGSKGVEVVISPSAPTTEMLKSVTARIGPIQPNSKGTCYKDEKGVIVFATKDLSKEGLIRQTFTKAAVPSKLVFRAPRPEEEHSETNEEESSGGLENPLPVGEPFNLIQQPPPPQPQRPQQPPLGQQPQQPQQPEQQRVRQQPGQQPPPPQQQRPQQPPQGQQQRPQQPPQGQQVPPPQQQQRPQQPPQGQQPPPPQQQRPQQPPQGQQPRQPQPPPKRTLPSVKVSIDSKFSKNRMTQIKSETDRGFFKGMGEFKEVFKGVEGMQTAESKLMESAKGKPLDQKAVTFLVSRYEALISKVDTYQSKFNEDNTAKVSSRKRKDSSDNVRDTKLAFSDETKAFALQSIVQLKYPDKVTALETLSQKNAQTGLTVKEENTFHETRAELMMLARSNGEVEKAEGGTSDVKILRNFDGSVGYVFKGLDGESDQMQLGKGAGTAQEILTGKMSEMIKKRCGFDSGFPKTTLAKLPIGGGEGKPGALIEGISGSPIAEIGSLAMDEYNDMSKEDKAREDELSKQAGVWDGSGETSYFTRLKKEQTDRALALPPATVQKVLLMNLMSSGADIKWTNMMVDGTEARPFDGGGNMLSEEAMMKSAQARRDDVKRGLKTGDIDPLFGTDLLYLPDRNGKHPVASQPLDPAFVKQILSLKPDEIASDMTEEINQLKDGNPEFDNAVGDSNVQASKRSLEALQAAIRKNPTATTEEFLNEYNEQVKIWLNEVKNRN